LSKQLLDAFLKNLITQSESLLQNLTKLTNQSNNVFQSITSISRSIIDSSKTVNAKHEKKLISDGLEDNLQDLHSAAQNFNLTSGKAVDITENLKLLAKILDRPEESKDALKILMENEQIRHKFDDLHKNFGELIINDLSLIFL